MKQKQSIAFTEFPSAKHAGKAAETADFRQQKAKDVFTYREG